MTTERKATWMGDQYVVTDTGTADEWYSTDGVKWVDQNGSRVTADEFFASKIVLCGGPGTPTLCEHLSAKAIARLAEQYDIAALERDWAEGNYGRLYATDTAEQLGRATMQQAIASYEEGYEGHIETHLHGPVEHGLASCYVAPE